MPLRLEVTSRHREALGESGVKDFGVDGGTIGRSLESNWVLDDSKRFISSRHASIDFRSGSYYLVDTSTNGVFINEESKPVGRGKPQRLFDGDRVKIGEFDILVHLVDDESTGEPLEEKDHVDPVVAAQHVEAPDPTGIEMLSEHEITAVGIELLLSEEAEEEAIKLAAEHAAESLSLEEDSAPETDSKSEPKTAPTPKSAPRTQAKQPAKSRAKPKPQKKPAPAAAKQKQASQRPQRKANAGAPPGDLSAFFRGAGLTPRKLNDKTAETLLQRLGQLTRELVVGVTEQLHLRAEQKNMLRLPHTTIKPNNNNALKFSAGVDEALTNLLLKDTEEYMSGVESAREAFHDIRIHQQALVSAVRVAVIDYLERIDPEELERKFHHGNKRNALIGVASKMKYWDLYQELHEVISRHSPGEFPQLFAEELTRAYEEEEARLQGKPTGTDSKAETG